MGVFVVSVCAGPARWQVCEPLNMDTSRYPRYGYGIAPKSLQEVLDIPLPNFEIKVRTDAATRCSELDQSAWTHFGANACKQLGQLVVTEVAAHIKSFPDKVLTRKLPSIPKGIELDDLRLEPRTRNCLQQLMSYAGIARLGELRNLTIGEIIHTQGLGARSLVDLLTALESAGVTENFRNSVAPAAALNASLTDEATRLVKTSSANTILLGDPRLGRYLDELFAYTASMDTTVELTKHDVVRTMAERIANRKCDPPNSDSLGNRLRVVRKQIAILSRSNLEKELRAVVAQTQAKRSAAILLRRFGWDGGLPCTLGAAGSKFGIGESAVGRICMHFADTFAGKKLFLPALDKALALVRTLLPAPAHEVEFALAHHGLTEKKFRLESILSAADFFNRTAGFKIETYNGIRIALPEEAAGLTGDLNRSATQTITWWGATTIAEVTERIKIKPPFSVSREFAYKVLLSRKDIVWLDQQRHWFYFSSIRHNRLRNLVKNLLSSSAALGIDEILAALTRRIRRQRHIPPRHVLLEFCRQLPMCYVDGDVVYASSDVDARDSSRKSELHLLSV